MISCRKQWRLILQNIICFDNDRKYYPKSVTKGAY